MWTRLNNYRDAALLVFRVIFGSFFIYVHGWPKLAGGLARWKQVGAAMKNVGLDFWPGMWGFFAAFSETIGAALLIIGFCFRPAAALLLFTMIVASTTKIGGRLVEAAHPIEMAMVFALLIFIGPGRFSADKS